MGTLKIKNREIKIKHIKVESRFSEIYVQPEFTFSINVYNPDEDDSPLIVSYDHILKRGITNETDLLRDVVELSYSDLNEYGNLIYVDDEEFEAMDLSFQITKNPLGKSISGRGNLRNEETEQMISLNFQADIRLSKTEHIKYDFSNYKYQRESMIEVLESIASRNDLIEYKQSVPYVHIPFEVLSEWESAYGIKYKWFYDEYSATEIQHLTQIDEQISSLYEDFEGRIDKFPDVPEILENKKWIDLMNKCQNTLEKIKST